ncbi:MAG: hypothetical protein JST40_11750 [Armatimonadetes bacterium]|nr:hypothetical protein [Armatimonadota bacterium]
MRLTDAEIELCRAVLRQLGEYCGGFSQTGKYRITEHLSGSMVRSLLTRFRGKRSTITYALITFDNGSRAILYNSSTEQSFFDFLDGDSHGLVDPPQTFLLDMLPPASEPKLLPHDACRLLCSGSVHANSKGYFEYLSNPIPLPSDASVKVWPYGRTIYHDLLGERYIIVADSPRPSYLMLDMENQGSYVILQDHDDFDTLERVDGDFVDAMERLNMLYEELD